VALALASRFSRMLSFQIKDMEFTGSTLLLVRMCFPRQRLKHGMDHLEQLEYLEYLEPAHKSVFTHFFAKFGNINAHLCYLNL
jgi:hypothetical protein